MTDGSAIALAVLLIGIVAILAAPVRAGFTRIGLPDVIGYILIGLALTAADSRYAILSDETRHGLDTLAAAGIVVLLFRAGLESHPRKLMNQLPRASFALLGNIIACTTLGYATARYAIGAEPLQAVFVAIALTATSVGVSVAIWREAGAIDTERGALLVDLAELDDVAAVFLLAILLALVPVIHFGAQAGSAPNVVAEGAQLIATLAVFAAACLLFAAYAEEKISRWFDRLDGTSAAIIPIAGIAFVIAALAELLGLSLAVGALLAGLAFSRDPKRVRMDKAFDTIYRLFVPFFFVGIGLDVAVGALPEAGVLGAVLLVAAVLAKVGGIAVPLLFGMGGASALLIGISMVPRAEIAMIVMERGRALGDWAVPSDIYNAMVVVTVGTCVLTPPVVRFLLNRERKRRPDHEY